MSAVTTVSNQGVLESALILLLVFSVFVNLYFLSKRVVRRKKSEDKDVVDEFLKTEMYACVNAAQRSDPEWLMNEVAKFRGAYLAIERKARREEPLSKQYWTLIQKRLLNLFDLIWQSRNRKLVFDINQKIELLKKIFKKYPSANKRNAVVRGLEKVRDACEQSSDLHRLKKLDRKITDLIVRMSNPQFLNLSTKLKGFDKEAAPVVNRLGLAVESMDASCEKLASHVDDEKDKLDKLSSGNEELRKRVRDVDDSMSAVRDRVSQFNTSVFESTEKISELGREMGDLTEEMIDAGDREIKRLRTVVGEQKQTITELEKSLEEVKKIEAESAESSPEAETRVRAFEQEMELIKKSLREAEQCVVMLENELKEIQDEKSALLNQNSDSTASDEAVKDLQSKVEALEQEIGDSSKQMDRLKELMSYIKDALGASSPEDMAFVIFQSFQSMGYEPSLLVRGRDRVIDVNSSGKLAPREKLLIENMRPQEVNLSRSGDQLSFKLNHLGGIVQAGVDSPSIETERELILALLKIFDGYLATVGEVDEHKKLKRSLDEVANSMKKAMNDVDHCVESLLKRSDTIMRDGFGQMQDVGRSAGLNATKIAALQRLEETAVDELKAEQRSRMQIKRSLLSLLKELEAL
jgi:chromosome segregation ATPase